MAEILSKTYTVEKSRGLRRPTLSTHDDIDSATAAAQSATAAVILVEHNVWTDTRTDQTHTYSEILAAF